MGERDERVDSRDCGEISLLPYWYTLFANASTNGTPPVRALFWEFPDEAELFAVDRQFLVGRDILVTPVLTSNVSTVDGIFPGRGKIIWRDWYTHDVDKRDGGGQHDLVCAAGAHQRPYPRRCSPLTPCITRVYS